MPIYYRTRAYRRKLRKVPTWGLRKWVLPPGRPGDRFTLAELERASGVPARQWSRWHKRGLFSASKPRPGVVLVRRAAVRKAIQHPTIAQAIVRAQQREGEEKDQRRDAGGDDNDEEEK